MFVSSMLHECWLIKFPLPVMAAIENKELLFTAMAQFFGAAERVKTLPVGSHVSLSKWPSVEWLR